MTSHDLKSVALTLVREGKGILAADETPRKRLAYRVMIRPTGASHAPERFSALLNARIPRCLTRGICSHV